MSAGQWWEDDELSKVYPLIRHLNGTFFKVSKCHVRFLKICTQSTLLWIIFHQTALINQSSNQTHSMCPEAYWIFWGIKGSRERESCYRGTWKPAEKIRLTLTNYMKNVKVYIKVLNNKVLLVTNTINAKKKKTKSKEGEVIRKSFTTQDIGLELNLKNRLDKLNFSVLQAFLKAPKLHEKKKVT